MARTKNQKPVPAQAPEADRVGPTGADLACGCKVVFRAGADESPILVVIERKAEGCGLALHVEGLPVYDRRAALRPPTRVGPPLQPDFEDG